MGGSVGGAGNFGNQQVKPKRPGMNIMDDPRQAMMGQQRAMQGGPLARAGAMPQGGPLARAGAMPQGGPLTRAGAMPQGGMAADFRGQQMRPGPQGMMGQQAQAMPPKGMMGQNTNQPGLDQWRSGAMGAQAPMAPQGRPMMQRPGMGQQGMTKQQIIAQGGLQGGMLNQLRQAPMGQQGMMGQQRAMQGGPQGGLGNMLMQEAQGGKQDPRLLRQKLQQSMGGRGAPGGK